MTTIIARSAAFIPGGTDVRLDNRVVGRVIADSTPDPDHEGYHLIHMAISPNEAALMLPEVFAIVPPKALYSDMQVEAALKWAEKLGRFRWSQAPKILAWALRQEREKHR
jgi:hypothetical protein